MTSRTPSPRERTQLLTTLYRALREATTQSALFNQAVAELLGITVTDLECLDIIKLHGSVAAGELAAATGLTTGAITGVIDRLERAGFAERARDESDRRKVFVRLAPRVDERLAPFLDSRLRAMDTLLHGYSPAQLKLLIDFATRSHEISLAETAKLRAAAGRRA
jgi:DNA-binding MarR family transcriptional regulator